MMMKKGINAKSGNYSGGAKSGVCKDFKDIYKLMDLVQELQNSEQTLRTSGQKVTEGSVEDGNDK